MKICVSEDEEHVAEIRAVLKENGGYCPCRLIKTPETKCPCQEFRARNQNREYAIVVFTTKHPMTFNKVYKQNTYLKRRRK